MFEPGEVVYIKDKHIKCRSIMSFSSWPELKIGDKVFIRKQLSCKCCYDIYTHFSTFNGVFHKDDLIKSSDMQGRLNLKYRSKE